MADALCKIKVLCQGRVLFAVTLDDAIVPFRVEHPQAIYAGDPFGVRLKYDQDRLQGRLRLLLGSEEIWSSGASDREFSFDSSDAIHSMAMVEPSAQPPEAGSEQFAQTLYQPWLRNEFGDSQISLEIQAPEDDDYRLLFALPLKVTPRDSVYRDFVALVDEINQVHTGLVQDVVGRAWVKQGLLGEAVTRLQPDTFVSYLDTLNDRLTRAVQSVARQPSTRLERSLAVVRYRSGDRLDRTAIASLARSRDTRVDSRGQICYIGKIRTRRPCLTEDLPEHRHIAAQLRRLSRKAHELARHCDQTADALESEEGRWGRDVGPSVFDQYHKPRLLAYRELAAHARRAALRFRKLIERHSFLAEAAPPRSSFGPSPVFLNRASYREVYRLLCEARHKFGILLDEDAVRLHYKDFPTLYEMWCFLRVVAHLNERLGSPMPDPPFVFDQEIYHPTLPSGQRFRYQIARDVHVEVCYEASFLPWREAKMAGEMFGAAFTSEPLRPDITVTVHYFDEPPVILVLDAKSTDSFSFRRFREISDYSRQIFTVRDGRQPVQQVFLLHRDRSRTSLSNMTNIPHYLKGREVPFYTVILGAIPVVPADQTRTAGLLQRVLDRFLAIYADLPQPAKR